MADIERQQQELADTRHAQIIAQQEEFAQQGRDQREQQRIRNGYVYNEATDKWVPGPNYPPFLEAKRQAAIEAGRKRMITLAQEQKQAERNYWYDIKDAFWEGVVKDMDDLPGQIKDAARAGGKTVANFVVDTVRELKDPGNWQCLGEAAWQTGKDLLGSPLRSGRKVATFYEDVGKGGAQVVTRAVTHPVDTLKFITGLDNWEKVIDPNVPVAERIGRALFGVVDGAANIVGVGEVVKGIKLVDMAADASKAVRNADKVLDTAKAADQAGDAAKAARAENEVSDAGKGARLAERAGDAGRVAREKSWEDARAAGKSNVDEFEKAEKEAQDAWKSGDEAANKKLRDEYGKGAPQPEKDFTHRPEARKLKPDRLCEVRDYLSQNPEARNDHYINMDRSRLADAIRTGHLQPGDYGAVAATSSGTGPGPYLFPDTHVVHISKAECEYAAIYKEGVFYDSNGRPIPQAKLEGKVVMLPGPGAEHQVMYVDSKGAAHTAIPVHKLERWDSRLGKFVPADR